MSRYLLRLCLAWCVVVVTASFAVAQDAGIDLARYKAEIDAFRQWDAKNAAPADAVLFVGSSTIRLWSTAEAFPSLPVINRGFGGSQILEVNHYIQDVTLKYKPAVVVFYAGDNDINAGRTPAQVEADYREFVQRVLAVRADTRVVFLAIKPSPARWDKWPAMRDANDRVRALGDRINAERAGAPALFYADVATPMLTADGQTQAHLYADDGLHLSAAGYASWNRVLAPLLDRLDRVRTR
ncbi:MAG: hypothetical protein ABS36_01645 [Acidobacteria bacterium SCN 69-37]|nr:MAG: hypothetical protein ABS36_01645 [Acidobacteria bacterium SCN 69-37]